jgi:DnaJ family protein C protein 9
MSEQNGNPPIIELDPYETLGVLSTATATEIRTAYRKRALAIHPDKAKPEERDSAHKEFQNLALAYAVLSDEKRRNRYDRTGSTTESAVGDEDFDWGSFFREQYHEINHEAIEKFKKEYQGNTRTSFQIL